MSRELFNHRKELASKLAPTGFVPCRNVGDKADRSFLRPGRQAPHIPHLWERACPRWHQRDPAGMPRRLHREASSLLQQTPHPHTPVLWERACPRWHHRDPAGIPRRLHREASSLLQQTFHTHTPALWERACPRWHHHDPAGMPPSPASRGKIAPCNPGPGHRYYKRHLTRTGDLSFPETGFSALTRNRLR